MKNFNRAILLVTILFSMVFVIGCGAPDSRTVNAINMDVWSKLGHSIVSAANTKGSSSGMWFDIIPSSEIDKSSPKLKVVNSWVTKDPDTGTKLYGYKYKVVKGITYIPTGEPIGKAYPEIQESIDRSYVEYLIFKKGKDWMYYDYDIGYEK